MNAPCCAPVAGSPERRVSAFARLPSVRLNRARKPGGSVPPLLKKLLIAAATLHWLMLNPQPSALGALELPAVAAALGLPGAADVVVVPARFAIRFNSASV